MNAVTLVLTPKELCVLGWAFSQMADDIRDNAGACGLTPEMEDDYWAVDKKLNALAREVGA